MTRHFNPRRPPYGMTEADIVRVWDNVRACKHDSLEHDASLQCMECVKCGVRLGYWEALAINEHLQEASAPTET